MKGMYIGEVLEELGVEVTGDIPKDNERLEYVINKAMMDSEGVYLNEVVEACRSYLLAMVLHANECSQAKVKAPLWDGLIQIENTHVFLHMFHLLIPHMWC